MFGEATGWYFVGTDYGDLKQVLKLLICGFFKILMFFFNYFEDNVVQDILQESQF